MRIGLTADFHLDKRLGYRHDERGINLRSRDLEAAVREVIDGFIRTEVEVAVIAGDLFDNAKPSEQARQFLVSEIHRLQVARPACRILILRGNHDAAMSFSDATAIGTAALALPGVLVADAYQVVRVEYDGVVFTLLPWMRSDAEFLAAVEVLRPVEERHNILLIHCGLADLPEYAELRPGSQTLTRSLVPSGFDVIFSGHYHMYRRLEDLGWTFIGSPERLSVAEVGSTKGFLTYDTATQIIVQHVIPTRPWYDLGTLNGADWDGQRLLAELRALQATLPDWSEALIRLRVHHLRPDVLAALDRVEINRISAAAFYADIELRADDPTFLLADEEGVEDPILLDDLPKEWSRHAASLAGRRPEEIARITRLGLAALQRGNLAAALAAEESPVAPEVEGPKAAPPASRRPKDPVAEAA